MTWLKTEDRGALRWLTLDRPDRRNAIPSDGWSDLTAAFTEFESSSRRVLIIRGAGDDFCSGADLDPDVGRNEGVMAARERMATVGAAAVALHRLTKPTIAAVRGVAVGAGMNLALGCDVVVCGYGARFSEIFVRRGLTVDFGGSWLLPRMVGIQRAKELALSGRMVDSEEAVRIGLALERVEDGAVFARVGEIAQMFVDGAPVAQMFAKQGISRSFDVSFEQAVGWEGQSQAICLTTDDFDEGVAAFLEKRPPAFGGG